MDMASKPKGTQPNHAVTDHTNHTSPVTKAQVNDAENQLKQKLKSGKVKDITKTKQDIANKTGVWPNGATN